MLLNYLYYLAVIAGWCLTLCFLFRFFLDWSRNEPEKLKAWLVLAAVCLPPLLLSFFIAPRGGMDDDFEFTYAGINFFSLQTAGYFRAREFAPLFTDALSDLLSGRSPQALLLKNRLLSAASAFILFAGLRRLGAGLAVAGTSAGFLVFNFFSLLCASSFSTTPANLFIWLTSLAALAEAHAAPVLSATRLAWALGSMVLVFSSRYEFLPVNLLLFAALVAARGRSGGFNWRAPLNLAALAAFGAALAVWAAHTLRLGTADYKLEVVKAGIPPLANLFLQLGRENFSALADRALSLAWTGWNLPPAADAALPLFFIVLSLGTAFAAARLEGTWSAWRFKAALGLAVWVAYFSVIYVAFQHYPLQLMRHRLYFFMPFVFIFALGLASAGVLMERLRNGRVLFARLCVLFSAAWLGVNAALALELNSSRRTSDLELEFLAGARAAWQGDCRLLYPIMDARNLFLRKYFPIFDGRGKEVPPCLLKYVSPAGAVFRDADPRFLRYAPLAASSEPWKTASFTHAFYTNYNDSSGFHELREPLPLTIGFYRVNGGADLAAGDYMRGKRAYAEGDLPRAATAFRTARERDPSCLPCGYALALSLAALGEKPEAESLMKSLSARPPFSVTPLYGELLRAVLSGDQAGQSAALKALYRPPGMARPQRATIIDVPLPRGSRPPTHFVPLKAGGREKKDRT